MPATDPGLRRVSVHSGTAVADLALPAGIPVAILTPSIVDILNVRDADSDADHGVIAKPYHLSLPGASALDPSKTLAQSGIGDGAVLLLSRPSAPRAPARHHDVAEAVSEALAAASEPWTDARRRRAARLTGATAAGCLTAIGALVLARKALAPNEARATVAVAAAAALLALLSAAAAHRACRDAVAGLALNAMAVGFATVAGLLAVPGATGVCNVLLAATAAAVTCVLALRVSPCGVVILTAACCVATIVAVAAFVGVVTAAPPHAIGAASALASLGLLGVAARMSVLLAGLSPQLLPTPDMDETEAGGAGLAARALRADAWLSSLLAGFSSAAAVGAVVTVLAGAPRLSCMAFGAVTGALLLLRARSSDSARMLTFVIAGIGVVGATFGVAAWCTPGHGPWVAAATATLAAAATYVGCVAPTVSLPPLLRRGVEATEWLALAAMVPLTGWICGLYGAVRGLNLK